MDDLPLATPHLPGTGGELKRSPADFVVEEIPAYEPCGEGEHVYLRVRREGRTTREVQRALALAFAVAERDVGCAGQKDKVARVTQTFSLPLRLGDPEDLRRRAEASTGLEVLAAARHRNKLGRGHLSGNRFEIILAGVVPNALERARAIAAALSETGVPNYFGEQRFGADGRNATRGARRIGAGERNAGFVARFELSAWQSEIFNAWLADRMLRGLLARVLRGDLAKKTAGGGLFEVVDEAAEQARCARGEISATGPIAGATMRAASGEPGEIERALIGSFLEKSGADASALERQRLPGSRRAARVFPRELGIEPHEDGLRLSFVLEPGAYATVVLREIAKA